MSSVSSYFSQKYYIILLTIQRTKRVSYSSQNIVIQRLG